MSLFDHFMPVIRYRTGRRTIQEKFEKSGHLRSSESGRFELKIASSQGAVELKLKHNGEPCRLETLELIAVNPQELFPGNDYLIYQHGFQSWSATSMQGAKDRDVLSRFRWKHNMDENPERPYTNRFIPAKKGLFYSEGMIGLNGTNQNYLVSQAKDAGQHVRFRIQLRPKNGAVRSFSVIWDFNGMLTRKHLRKELSPVIVKQEPSKPSDFFRFLDKAGGELSSHFSKPPNRPDQVSGWCSWYYYYTNISESILLDNLSLLKARQSKIDFFQIDDGYQKNIGDWIETNGKFPAGMRRIAQISKESGFRAGIWLAPFLARPDSDLLKQKPHLLLKDHKNRPVRALYNPHWGGNTYALDITHPDYFEYMHRVIDHFVSIGYTYLKLDFLFAAFKRGQYHNEETTGAMRLRKALEQIRSSAGKKVFILGCGCPLFSSTGIVDGQRVSMDTNSYWEAPLTGKLLRDRNFPALRPALQNNLLRSFMHRRFWLNDPDCLMLRNIDTKLTDAQVRISAIVMAVASGMILISDDLSLLGEKQFQWLDRILELNRKCAKYNALPLFRDRESELKESGPQKARHFPDGVYNPAGYLSVWNTSARPVRLRLLLPAGVRPGQSCTDFFQTNESGKIPWTVEEAGAGRYRLTVVLAPYESYLTKV